jgi:hypothetical protein
MISKDSIHPQKIFRPLNKYLQKNNRIIKKKKKCQDGICKKYRICKKPPPSILPTCPRIISIGDIHGDFEALLSALLKSSVINKKGHWIGGDTIVVQVGDFLDRGGRGNMSQPTNNNEEELHILQYMNYLHKKSVKHGGGVFMLIGNHELMNILGDFRYADSGHIDGFGGNDKRLRLFRPGGKMAQRLACHTCGIMKIGSWVFVHGGFLPKYAKQYSLDTINLIVRNIILGNTRKEHIDANMEGLLFGDDGIFWTRTYSYKENQDVCNLSDSTLEILKVPKQKGGIVVGHTIQENINSICNNRVWRIDTGMSEAFGKRENDTSTCQMKGGSKRIQVLEILNDGEKINIL